MIILFTILPQNAGVNRLYRKHRMRLRRAIVLVVAAAAGGCASNPAGMGAVFVAPGKYQPYRCDDLARAYPSLAQREAVLGRANERARESSGALIVHTAVHGAELTGVREELRQIREVAREKNCTLETPAPAAANR